jgi:hypothetical protein
MWEIALFSVRLCVRDGERKFLLLARLHHPPCVSDAVDLEISALVLLDISCEMVGFVAAVDAQ